MADVVDITDDRTEFEIATRVKAIASQKRELEPTGYCHFCESELEHPKLFCDIECSKDWEKRNKRV